LPEILPVACPYMDGERASARTQLTRTANIVRGW
jgi:hypothetical protein